MDIYKELTDLITKYDIQPARLHLEITETSVMNNAQGKHIDAQQAA